jgi:hypothetical protein
VIVNNSTIINGHLSPQIVHDKNTTAYDVRNRVSGLGNAQM